MVARGALDLEINVRVVKGEPILRRSFIRDIPDEALVSLLKLNENVQGIAEYLGVDSGGNAYRILLDRIKSINPNYLHKRKRSKFLIPLEDILIENSPATRATVRVRVIRDNLIPYRCAMCLNPGVHNGKPLSLHLDHINGVSDDHRVGNLRFLCPNCHTQTPTYAGRNSKKRLQLPS